MAKIRKIAKQSQSMSMMNPRKVKRAAGMSLGEMSSLKKTPLSTSTILKKKTKKVKMMGGGAPIKSTNKSY